MAKRIQAKIAPTRHVQVDLTASTTLALGRFMVYVAELNVVRHRRSLWKQTVLSVFNAVLMVIGPVGILMGIINAALLRLGDHLAHSAHCLRSAATQRKSMAIMAILFALKAMRVVLSLVSGSAIVAVANPHALGESLALVPH
jgi:hypothetical protein